MRSLTPSKDVSVVLAFGLASMTEPDPLPTADEGDFDATANAVCRFADGTGTGVLDGLTSRTSVNGLSTARNGPRVPSFDFILDNAAANSVTAQFLFATDEFPTESVTDIMGIFVTT